MPGFLKICLITLVTFLVIDGAWLVVMVPNFYGPNMGDLLAVDAKMGAAVLFYILYAIALSALVVRPALVEGSVIGAAWRGALMGAAAYGTYNLTNYATVEGWPLIVTVVDQVWGTSLGAAVASVSFLILRRKADQ